MTPPNNPEERIKELEDLAETAWGLIANSIDWNMGENTDEVWRDTARLWRDKYHKLVIERFGRETSAE